MEPASTSIQEPDSPAQTRKLWKSINALLILIRNNKLNKAQQKRLQERLSKRIKLLECNSVQLRRLGVFTMNFCLGRDITQSDIDALTICEKLIFMAVVVKKKYYRSQEFDFSLESVSIFKTRRTVRISQEHYKQILRGLLKALKRDYLYRFPWERGPDFSVYDEYFLHADHGLNEACAREYSQDIPGLFATNKRAELISLCKSSPEFMDCLIDYLDDSLVFGTRRVGVQSDAFDNITRKVPQLVQNWQGTLLQNKEQAPHCLLAQFLLGFMQNRYVKLPWTIHEVSQAVKVVKYLFDLDSRLSEN